MSNNENTNETPLTLKRMGVFLKEKGFSPEPLPEATDVVETLLINKKQLLSVMKTLKSEKDAQFDLLMSVSGVDKINNNIMEVVYHLFSTSYHHKLVVKVQLDRNKPSLPTVCEIWETANWHERETFDLMGIEFEGHPDLKRLLMPADWKGHPLRKDYIQDDERLIWNKR